MKMFIIAALTAIFLTIHGCRPASDWQTQLRTELQAYTLDAQIGIALLLENGDSLTLNNRQHYEMMSVFKFHQALAVCNYLHHHNQSLDTLLHITPDDLKPRSPIPGVRSETDICKKSWWTEWISVSETCWNTRYSKVTTMPVTFCSTVSYHLPRQTVLSETWD